MTADELGPTPEGTRTLHRSESSGRASQISLPSRTRQRYTILSEHARGGIGRILKVRDEELGRILAVKELLTPHPEAESRFLREALITARLEHPGIVPVHEAGRWESGEPFYAMKMVSGRTLKEIVDEKKRLDGRLSLLPNLIDVTEAIAYAHDRGVIHRDLKPSNLIVGDFGETIVIDWGLAKAVGEEDVPTERTPIDPATDQLTQTGAVLGTPVYMAPEQARGEDVDERADVYALGAILYFLLAGSHPYEGASIEVLRKVREEPPPPLEQREPAVPADLLAIVNKAMARDPARRYPTAKEMSQDLIRFRNGQLVGAHDYSWGQLFRRWVAKHRALVIATLAFLVLAAIGTGGFVLRERRLRQEADRQSIALLEERGRSELLDGRPHQAAVYLSEAYRRDPGNRRLRAWASQAVRPLSMHRGALVGHTHDVVSAAYSPDGRRLVTASTDKTARVWDVATLAPIATLEGHEKLVQFAVFSPDGERVLTGAGDETVRVWSAQTGALLMTVPDRDAYRVAWSPDGAYWVIGGHDGALRFRDASTGELLAESKLHTDRIYEIAFSRDGSRLGVAAADATGSVWDAHTRQLLFRMTDHENELSAIAFSDDGKWLITAESDVYVHLRRAADGVRIYSLRLPEKARWPQVSFSPDGLTIITRAFDGGVRIYHTTSGMLLSAFDAQVHGKLFQSAMRPDGRELTTVGLAGSANVWSLDDPGYRVLPLDVGRRKHVYPSIYLRGRDQLVTTEEDGHLTLWEAGASRVLQTLQVPGNAYSIADAGGGRVVVAGSMPESLPPRLFDLVRGEEIGPLAEHTRMVYNLAAADGVIATSSYDGKVRIYDGVTLSRAVDVVPQLRLASVGISQDAKVIAAADENGKLYLIDRASGSITKTIAAHSTWIQDVEFSKDGARIITAGRQDHTAKIWDAHSGENLLTIVAHLDNMARASFSPDGRLVATCALDHTAKIWDAATGDLLRIINGPSYTCEFSDDGRSLLTTGYHGYAVVWDLSTDERSATAIARYVAERSPWHLVDGRLVASE